MAVNTNNSPSNEGAPKPPSYNKVMSIINPSRTGGTVIDHISADYGGDSLFNEIIARLISDDQSGVSENVMIQNVANLAVGRNPYLTDDHATTLVNQFLKLGSLTKDAYIMYALPESEQVANTPGSGKSIFKSNASLKKHPYKGATELRQRVNYTLGSEQAYQIVRFYIDNGFSMSNAEYQAILGKYPYDQVNDNIEDANKNGTFDGVDELQIKYTRKLFNWYADNSKYYSGEIKIQGTTGIEIGKKLYMTEAKDGRIWEFYVESVEHSFDRESGWMTTVGVTRGLLLNDKNDPLRWELFYNKYEEFVGGYFGEPNLLTAYQTALSKEEDSGSGGDSDDSGGTGKANANENKDIPNIVKKAVKNVKSLLSKKTIYSQPAHIAGKNPITMAEPKMGDCSSLVYFAYTEAGFSFGVNSVLSTWGFTENVNLKKVCTYGTDRDKAYSKLKVGDIILWDTVGKDAHMGMYIGDGNAVAFNTDGVKKFGMKDSYWWGVWKGWVLRAKN